MPGFGKSGISRILARRSSALMTRSRGCRSSRRVEFGPVQSTAGGLRLRHRGDAATAASLRPESDGPGAGGQLRLTRDRGVEVVACRDVAGREGGVEDRIIVEPALRVQAADTLERVVESLFAGEHTRATVDVGLG